MREPDNPFAMREAEQIENDSTFLKLFGPGMLDLLNSENLLNKPTVIISAPGGGKTSLMRIFTPQSLSNIYMNRAKDDDFKELYYRLGDFGAVEKDGPPVMLGAYLPCSSSYAELDDLDIETTDKDRLFFSLLNARLLSTVLIGLLTLRNLKFSNLDEIIISSGNLEQSAINGKWLFEYASEIETGICKKMDSFDFELGNGYAKISDLEYFSKLHPNNIKISGSNIISHLVVMLDDVQILTKRQRQALFTKLQQQRIPIPIWIAERKEALELDELILGEIGRDFQVIDFERFFKDGSKKYENLVISVANRRGRTSPVVEITNFSQCINDSIDGPEWEQKFSDAISTIRKRIDRKISNTKAYDAWILQQESDPGTPREKAIGWRTLEIQIQRHSAGGQQMLIDSALEVEAIALQSGLKAAGEFLLCDEFHIPYYFGLSRLANISSYNIQQYLGTASELFEKVISRSIIKKQIMLDPLAQEDVMDNIARSFIMNIPVRIPFGTYALNLLREIGQYARSESIRPTAPYLPGVTGIGLTSKYYDKIVHNTEGKQEFKILTQVLHSCLANNLLVADFDYRQGPKSGDSNVVLYLNRLLCAYFKLPLGYGGWRKTNPEELVAWSGLLKPSMQGGR